MVQPPDHQDPPAENKSTPPPDLEGQLLPGWSSLVILLSLFAVVSAVALYAIMRPSPELHVTQDSGGVRAYRPADFPDMDFNEPLLPSVVAAQESGQAEDVFNVPPPPFDNEDLFPCSSCHEDMEPDPERRELMFHDEIQLNHGPEERWCFDCHNATDRDHLRLVSGRLVGFDESYKLCGQCHGTIFRDWREGIHGRRRGYWNGAKSYLLCAHCHNPHAPAFKPLKPLPPPVRPSYLAGPEEPDNAEEEHQP
jgi:hypothetical protein